MKPAVSQVCTLNSTFDRDVEDYAQAHANALEIWLTKCETWLAGKSPGDARRLFDTHQIVAPVASFQGGLLTSQGAARKEAWDLFGRRLALCRELSVQTLVVAADIESPLTQQSLDRSQLSLRQAAQQAEQAGVRVALEFQARAAFCNNLQTAAALVADVASPFLGLCFDAFHYYIGPTKTEDLGLLTRDNLFHVQLSDLADVPRELARDGDRILPGDGDIPLTLVLDHLRNIQYEGYVSVEIMNPQLWQIPPRQLAEVAMSALRRILGQASMGGERSPA